MVTLQAQRKRNHKISSMETSLTGKMPNVTSSKKRSTRLEWALKTRLVPKVISLELMAKTQSKTKDLERSGLVANPHLARETKESYIRTSWPDLMTMTMGISSRETRMAREVRTALLMAALNSSTWVHRPGLAETEAASTEKKQRIQTSLL